VRDAVRSRSPPLPARLALPLPPPRFAAGRCYFFGLRAASIRLNSVQQTGIRRVLWRETVRSKVLGAATLVFAFQLLAATSTPAQGPQPSTPPGEPPPFSGIARNVVTWWHHVTHTGTHRHRIASSPPLPRPRPAQLAKAPELPATAVEPNEAHPVSTAVEPNRISPAPVPKVEQDKAPREPPAAAVEPSKAQPAASAVEPNMIPSTSAVEPGKTPAKLPPGAVEETKPPGTPTGTVLQGANIPD
jgi:hypothetical protein